MQTAVRWLQGDADTWCATVWRNTHRTDVHKLLGAHIVRTEEEGLVICVQELEQLGFVLHWARHSFQRDDKHHDFQSMNTYKQCRALQSVIGSSHQHFLFATHDCELFRSGPTRITDRKEFNLNKRTRLAECSGFVGMEWSDQDTNRLAATA